MENIGHDQVKTYEEFTRRLDKIFDRKDSNITFRDLVHVKHTGTPKSYIFEFKKLVAMVIDISEAILVLFFIEGPAEPFKGLVKAYKPPNLQDVIPRTEFPQEQIFQPNPWMRNFSKKIQHKISRTRIFSEIKMN